MREPVRITALNGRRVVKWVGTEMALSGDAFGEDRFIRSHPDVAYLQLISLDIQLADGSVYRMLSQSDDGSGPYGLYLMPQDVIDTPSSRGAGSIFQTRELSELPIGKAKVAVIECDGLNADLREEMVIEGQIVSFWAAELHERSEAKFEVVERDESILIHVDGKRPHRFQYGLYRKRQYERSKKPSVGKPVTPDIEQFGGTLHPTDFHHPRQIDE